MKRVILNTLCFIAAIVLFGSCIKELFENPSYREGEMIELNIPFGSPQGPGITVSTKATLSLSDESHVFNLYLLIFDGSSTNSKKVYGHYFDGNNLGENSDPANWWTVNNGASSASGTLHIKTAKKGGCTIVAVANMNPDDLDVSPGLLSTITTYGALQNIIATQVRSEIAANSGYFLMTDQISGVDILGNGSANDISTKTLHLKRLYAKVSFEVQVGKAGAAAGIRKFVPDKWQVVNVPTCAYLLERNLGDSWPVYDAAQDADQFFSTLEQGFETQTLAKDPDNPSNYVYYHGGTVKATCYGFSFYMMENRKAPYARSGDVLPSPFTYPDRERQSKDGSGHNTGLRYADERATYIVMSGKIVMGVTSDYGNENATLDANVQYIIHLGDFGSSNSDFNVLRNHNYLYRIYINGADDIKAEVLTGVENEPGATGRVVVAEEKVFDSDCHYSTQVISFHYNLIEPSQISWYVESPFNPEGAGPDDGLELSDIDYKWVEFHVNDMENGLYSQNRVEYKPHDWPKYDELGIAPGTKGHTMYVNEIVEYLKHQKNQYDLWLADPTLPKGDFDDDVDEHGNPDPKISVTAFVNEYYYEEHPTKGGFDPTLWKLVVNHPMRRLHILASSRKSADGESMSIGSSFTLQQRAIQSIYAVHEVEGLQSAWGMEFTDDEHETGLAVYWRNKNMEDCGNTSATNGRLNSLKLWGVLNPDGTVNPQVRYWEDFLDLHGTNETPQLWNDYNYLRYSCLSRNRDNNGNGIIDPEEIRWYMASDVQLIGVFLGSYGIEGDARLYQRDAEAQSSNTNNVWRQHIIASNRFPYPEGSPADWNNSNKYPRIVWAEEGVNGSNYNYNGTDQTTLFSTRCVRNLGYYMDGGQRIDITQADDPEIEPDPFVVVTRKNLETSGMFEGTYNDKTYYEFDCSRINTASLREHVDHQLIGHDEHSKMACLSSAFVTSAASSTSVLSTSHSFNGKTYNLKRVNELNQYLDDSFPNLDTSLSICPDGYRLPNVREMSIMWTMLSAMATNDSNYLGKDDNNAVPCRTHWSFGIEGSGKMNNKWGWGMSKNHLLMADNNKEMPSIRCVKDL